MTDQSDMDVFDSVISGTPVPEGTETQPAAIEQAPAGQPRSDNGQFSPKQPDKAAAVETVAAQQPAATAETQPMNGGIPVKAVQAEREKRQETQQENEALRRELAEMRGQLQVLTTQRQPQPQQEAPKPATLWDDPDAFLQNQFTPFQQQMQEMREELWESRAASVHTPEAVQAAKAAAEKLFGTPEGKVLHQQITSAGGNPFDNLVKWHRQQETLAKVGGDPDAWLNAELEKRMNDPAFLAQAMERARTAATSNTNRSTPKIELPPSLSALPSGGNSAGDGGDVSDGALFASTTTRRR